VSLRLPLLSITEMRLPMPSFLSYVYVVSPWPAALFTLGGGRRHQPFHGIVV